MDEATKLKLQQFSQRFKAQRLESEKRKTTASVASKTGKTSRFKLVNITGLSGDEAEDRLRLLRQIDDQNWQPLAVLITGQWQVCHCCGHEAIATSGFFFREKHRTVPSAKRLRAINHIPEGFDLEVNIEGVVLQRCVKCLEGNLVDDILATMLNDGAFHLSNQLELFKTPRNSEGNFS